MKSGVFAGTFDPVTNGHLDLIHRALGVVDRLVVAVAPRPEKGVLFSLEERVAMIKEAVGVESRVTVEPFQGLLVEHAKARGIPIIIRGVRFVSDFEYEFQMALMNRRLDPTIETIFLMPSEQFTYVNSTLVKEIARHGGDVNPFVPPNVRERLDKALRKPAAR
ncbi:MAG TPA: pantetheine-phosphate adenylyltransferase [Candidatus Eisenbacteria bacterium]|nr:pantetheine-phosphate adenylyltransferase [Candidatus Eisenbacteria bacterium]